MIERIAPLTRGRNEYFEVFLELALPLEIVQRLWAQRKLDALILILLFAVEHIVEITHNSLSENKNSPAEKLALLLGFLDAFGLHFGKSL